MGNILAFDDLGCSDSWGCARSCPVELNWQDLGVGEKQLPAPLGLSLPAHSCTAGARTPTGHLWSWSPSGLLPCSQVQDTARASPWGGKPLPPLPRWQGLLQLLGWCICHWQGLLWCPRLGQLLSAVGPRGAGADAARSRRGVAPAPAREP